MVIHHVARLNNLKSEMCHHGDVITVLHINTFVSKAIIISTARLSKSFAHGQYFFIFPCLVSLRNQWIF